jgi:hypothetical protein
VNLNRSRQQGSCAENRYSHVVLTYFARRRPAFQARAQALLQIHPRQFTVLATLSNVAM